jgi:hypothetical protein
MRRVAFLLAWAALLTGILLPCACNNVGDCPAPSAITPGGSCSGDTLECPYNLATPSPACDGTTVEGGLATSCICDDGKWSCPSPVSCDASTGDDAGDATTGGDAAGNDASEASMPEASVTGDGGPDAHD